MISASSGRYEKDGVNIPFFEVVVEEQEFAESKSASQSAGEDTGAGTGQSYVDENEFMQVPDDMEELPFN